ncbi:hypothetical protein OJ962_21685, partial [Solirubrobacter sp. CPCC 204708]
MAHERALQETPASVPERVGAPPLELALAGTPERARSLAATIGNQAFGRVLARNGRGEGGGGGGGGGTGTVAPPQTRTIMLDGNVLDQINRGNAAAASTLRGLQQAGHRLYVTHQAMREITDDIEDPQMRAAYRAMLADLQLTVAPAGSSSTMADRVRDYAANLRSNALSDDDLLVATQARASNAELWSLDRAYRRNAGSVTATIRGLRLAPECTSVPLVNSTWDYAQGRRLLNLPPITIDAAGGVTRPPTPPTGSGGAPPPTTPPPVGGSPPPPPPSGGAAAQGTGGDDGGRRPSAARPQAPDVEPARRVMGAPRTASAPAAAEPAGRRAP